MAKTGEGKQQRAIKDIANSLGVSCASVYKYIEREKYLKSEAATHEKKEYDPEKLRKEIESGLTIKQLAIRYGIGENTIRRRCNKHGILYGKARKAEECRQAFVPIVLFQNVK